MSFDPHKNWMYSLSGRHIHLWQWVETAATDTISNYRVKLPAEYYGKQLIYPNEDISNGLRIEYTSFSEVFAAESYEDTSERVSASTIAFVDGGGGSDTITDTANGFGLIGTTDKIRVIGSASNDGDYQLTNSAAGTLTMATGLLTAESLGESITIYQIPKAVADASVDESSHVNLNRMLSLAVVDYVKAQIKESQGDLQGKEYCMREFWKKVGDNESNKRKVSMTFPASPFAIK